MKQLYRKKKVVFQVVRKDFSDCSNGVSLHFFNVVGYKVYSPKCYEDFDFYVYKGDDRWYHVVDGITGSVIFSGKLLYKVLEYFVEYYETRMTPLLHEQFIVRKLDEYVKFFINKGY